MPQPRNINHLHPLIMVCCCSRVSILFPPMFYLFPFQVGNYGVFAILTAQHKAADGFKKRGKYAGMVALPFSVANTNIQVRS